MVLIRTLLQSYFSDPQHANKAAIQSVLDINPRLPIAAMLETFPSLHRHRGFLMQYEPSFNVKSIIANPRHLPDLILLFPDRFHDDLELHVHADYYHTVTRPYRLCVSFLSLGILSYFLNSREGLMLFKLLFSLSLIYYFFKLYIRS